MSLCTSELQSIILLCQNSSLSEFITHYNTLQSELVKSYNPQNFKALSLRQIGIELNNIIDFCNQHNISNPKILREILKCWCQENDDDIDGVIGDMAGSVAIRDQNLHYVCQTLQKFSTPVSILDEYITTRYGNTMIFGMVAERILKSFEINNLDDSEWDHLYRLSESSLETDDLDPRVISIQMNPMTKDNKDIKDYINIKKLENQRTITISKPKYVNLKDHENIEMYTSLSKIEMQDFDVSDEKHNDLKNELRKFVKIKEHPKPESGDVAPFTVDQAIDLFLETSKPNIISPDSQVIPQRFYGPYNPIGDVECCSLPLPGPCCMFYCICKEFDSDDGELYDVDDMKTLANRWFTGFCEHCNKSIPKLRYAVRYPLEHGGWEGCFCSFECIYKSKMFPIYKNDDLRIKEIVHFLNKYGVADL